MIVRNKIVKGYRVNFDRSDRPNLYICNCVYGHMNCKCDGNGKKIRD